MRAASKEKPLTAAQRRMVEENLRLVHWLVNRYLRRRQWLEHFREDLVQAGVEGLIRGVQKFDPAAGTLATYARWWIDVRISETARRMQNPAGATRRLDGGGGLVWVERGEMPIQEPAATSFRDSDAVASMPRVVDELVRVLDRRLGRTKRRRKWTVLQVVQLFLRYRFEGGTLDSAAAELGVTRARTQQLFAQAELALDQLAEEIRAEAA